MELDKPSENGAPLPKRISSHCFVKVNSEIAVLMGGLTDGTNKKKSSDKTLFFSLDLKIWSNGRKLNYKRHNHACGALKDSHTGRDLVIVVGGDTFAECDDGENCPEIQPEMFDVTNSSWSIIKGLPSLPNVIMSHSQMTNIDHFNLLMIGGVLPNNAGPMTDSIQSSYYGTLEDAKEIYWWKCFSHSCFWTVKAYWV